MNLSLTYFEYSPILIFVCAALGIGYAIFYYYKSRLSDMVSRWKIILLGTLRALAVFLIALLLLGPFIRYIDSHIEEPRIVAIVDNTQSMVAPMIADSTDVHKSIVENLEILNEHFEVDTVTFSDAVESENKLRFDGKATNIDEALTYVKSRYEGIPLAGIVMMTDGIYNQGKNPIYSISGLKAPVYPIPYGDTTKRSDIKVAQVLYNKIAYLGDEFPLEVDIVGEKMSAQSHSLNLYLIEDNGERRLLERKSLEIDDGAFFKTIPFHTKASIVGVQHLQVSIPPLSGELTTVNNYRDIFIDVIDSRQKIAFIGSSPHPDIGAISAALFSFKNYEVKKFIFPDVPHSFETYDFVILHQIPSQNGNTRQFLAGLEKVGIPILWIVGSQTDLAQLNRSQDIIQLNQKNRQNDEVQAYANAGFTYFNLDKELKNEIPLYPPLDVPYADFITRSSTQVLLNQTVGNIQTEKPLIALRDENNHKSGIIVGEGIWRWKLYDYMENSNNENFNNLISQLVKFLSTRKDLRRFVVESNKRIYEENEKVRFTANVYNEAYQSVMEPTISMVISSEESRYDYVFTPLTQNYSLDAGYFKPGTYQWTSETTFDGSQHKNTGQFIVQEIQKEFLDLEADHALLRHLAEQTGGVAWHRDGIESQVKALKDSPYSKKVKYTTERNKPLIAIQWVGGLIILLLLFEWLFRRLLGDY